MVYLCSELTTAESHHENNLYREVAGTSLFFLAGHVFIGQP